MLIEPHIEEADGAVVLVARYGVNTPGPVELSAQLSIVVWEGRESDPPAGAGQPRVLEWRTASGTITENSCTVEGPTEVELVVLPVPDTATDMSVAATPWAESTEGAA
jgi:hypothetical protein